MQGRNIAGDPRYFAPSAWMQLTHGYRPADATGFEGGFEGLFGLERGVRAFLCLQLEGTDGICQGLGPVVETY